MIKHLSKRRFLLLLSVAIFLVVVLLVQFIILFTMRSQGHALDGQLAQINSQIENLPDTVTDQDKKDKARWEEGYVNEDEKGNILIEE